MADPRLETCLQRLVDAERSLLQLSSAQESLGATREVLQEILSGYRQKEKESIGAFS